MTKAVSKDTRAAILDAAERLMAEHGINGVSLRTILAEAKANAAALHYHFGSREDLIAAILGRPVLEKILSQLGLDPQPPPRGRRAARHTTEAA